jgi:hypothetical protein
MERKTLVVTQRSALWVVVGWPTEAATFMNGATEEDDELLKMRCNPRFCWLARPDSPNSVLLVLLWERVPFVGPLWVVLGPLDGLNISVACCDWKFNWYPQQRHIAVFFLLLDDDEESAISCRGVIVVHQVYNNFTTPYNNFTTPFHKGWVPYTVGSTSCEEVLYDCCTLGVQQSLFISCLLGDDYTFWHFLGVHKFHETCVWIINLLLLSSSLSTCVSWSWIFAFSYTWQLYFYYLLRKIIYASLNLLFHCQ